MRLPFGQLYVVLVMRIPLEGGGRTIARTTGFDSDLLRFSRDLYAVAERSHADEQAPPGVPAGRYDRGLGHATRIPGWHQAEDLGERSRRDRQDGQPHAAVALRSGRLHDRTVRAR